MHVGAYVSIGKVYHGIQETAHSFNKHLLSACYVPGIVICAGEAKSSPSSSNVRHLLTWGEVGGGRGEPERKKTNLPSKPNCTFLKCYVTKLFTFKYF